MTYRELYESAINKLEKSEITLGEFERTIKPLNAEVATDINVGDKDTISRKAAIDGKICIQRANGVEIYDDYAVPVEYLKQLPPIQPEHIRGHWICDRSWSEGVGMGESYGHYWKCDKCGHLEQGDWGECGCNFCSNCGSDNREAIM